MRKLLIAVVLIVLVLMPVMAGEYQAESIEYERAFDAGQYQAAFELAATGVGQGNALNALGYEAYKAGQKAKAKAYLERAIKADPEQYCRNEGEDHRVKSPHPIEKPRKGPRAGECEDGPEDDSHESHPQPLSENHLHDLFFRSPQREPHPELTDPLGHAVPHHPVQPDGCEDQSQ